MKAKLVVVGGNLKAREIPLDLPAVIGRGREATIRLPHPLVSRRHCEIFETDGSLAVRDLDSLNGTFVGDERVRESALPSGQLLTIGTVTFRAIYEARPDAAPADLLPAPERQDADEATTETEEASDSGSGIR